MKPFEILEHTAEIGVKAYGKDFAELFYNMTLGMFSLIVPLEEIQPVQTLSVTAQASDRERLLVAFLKELLYRFDVEGFLVCSVAVETLTDTQIQAKVTGETLDRHRHSVDKEVKAVTYCDLQVRHEPSGTWTAQVYFDI